MRMKLDHRQRDLVTWTGAMPNLSSISCRSSSRRLNIVVMLCCAHKLSGYNCSPQPQHNIPWDMLLNPSDACAGVSRCPPIRHCNTSTPAERARIVSCCPCTEAIEMKLRVSARIHDARSVVIHALEANAAALARHVFNWLTLLPTKK